ncbi:MAG: hypothetical protein AAGF48_15855 [Pseudomonadota bacterium]
MAALHLVDPTKQAAVIGAPPRTGKLAFPKQWGTERFLAQEFDTISD